MPLHQNFKRKQVERETKNEEGKKLHNVYEDLTLTDINFLIINKSLNIIHRK